MFMLKLMKREAKHMDDNSKRIKSMYIGQIINRVILILVFFLLLGNLIGTVYLGIQIRNFSKVVEPAVAVLNELDVEELNKTINTLNSAIDVFKINDTAAFSIKRRIFYCFL